MRDRAGDAGGRRDEGHTTYPPPLAARFPKSSHRPLSPSRQTSVRLTPHRCSPRLGPCSAWVPRLENELPHRSRLRPPLEGVAKCPWRHKLAIEFCSASLLA